MIKHTLLQKAKMRYLTSLYFLLFIFFEKSVSNIMFRIEEKSVDESIGLILTREF